MNGLPADDTWERVIRAVAGTAGPCCDLHTPTGCCDENDCGPCCWRCPTCPSTLRPLLVTGFEARLIVRLCDSKLRRLAKDMAKRTWKGGPDERPTTQRRYERLRAAATELLAGVDL